MQRKVKRHAAVYGILAILLVTIATLFAFEFSIYNPEGETPAPPIPTLPSALLSTFTSNEALKAFLLTNSKTQGPFPFFGPQDTRALPSMLEGFEATVSSSGLSWDYSSTNIQVADADEADIVKTDGDYIYALSNNRVSILKAHPPTAAEVVANITFADLSPAGMFVNDNRLAILGSKYFVPPSPYVYGHYTIDIKTFARIYDISNRTNPEHLHDLKITGSYFNSRMIGNYIYFVVSQPAYVIYDTVILPKIYMNDEFVKEIHPTEIHYCNGSDDYYQYTTVVAMNVQNISESPTYLSMMLGGTSSMYVSTSNMYVTFHEINGNTTIYRVRIQGNNMTTEARGHVIGTILNQFAMDEYNGYFRIATASWKEGEPRSNVFVKDMDLKTVGTLLNIEVGETLDSARFMQDRCYLSTSIVRRDPFFVIDVSNATDPAILGYLKIPGFTRYLHPYDENHVIGVGIDETNNVRISLFDVTNVNAPNNLSEYRFEGDWSDTPVLWDHKAFLFTPSKDLLTIPVSVTTYGPKSTMKQAAFVFNLTHTDGFVLKGSITHQQAEIDEWDTSYHVTRVLHIENVLYTISNSKVKLNSLAALTLLKEIPLS